MLKGSVKWFNNVKGYSFIITQGGTKELFPISVQLQWQVIKPYWRAN